jgi:hypothetical protein
MIRQRSMQFVQTEERLIWLLTALAHISGAIAVAFIFLPVARAIFAIGLGLAALSRIGLALLPGADRQQRAAPIRSGRF